MESQSTAPPLSPHFANATHDPSPSVGSGVRRHVSLTYGATAAGTRKGGLKRSGTLQAAAPPHSQNTPPPEPAERDQEEEYNYTPEDASTYDPYEDDYFPRQSYPASPPIGRGSPWTPSNEWRNSGYSSTGASIDDVQRALSTLELSNSQTTNYHPGGQSVHPPRFNPPYPPPAHVMGSRHGNSGSNGNGGGKNQLMTEYDGRQTTPLSQGRGPYMSSSNERGSWEHKERVLSNRTSNSSLQYGYQQGTSQHGKNGSSGSVSGSQYMQQPRLSATSPFGGQSSPGQAAAPGFINTPIDVPTLIATKGYNPIDFDTKPSFVWFISLALQSSVDVLFLLSGSILCNQVIHGR